MLMQFFDKAPDNLFSPALLEVSRIYWKIISDPSRRNKVFSTSQAIHLRSHKMSSDDLSLSMTEYSKITDCIDNQDIKFFPYVMKLCNWALTVTNGEYLGRVMIVKVSPWGKIDLHIDKGAYFDMYARFHIPVITDTNAVFINDKGIVEHMPVQQLIRLNNKDYHGLENRSEKDRIHIICDIKLSHPNEPF